MGCYFLEQISFGDIPNSRNFLFLQIFPQRAVKPSAGNTSAGSAPRPSPEPDLSAPKPPFSGTFSGTNLTWLCTRASQTFSGTFSGALLFEPDLALHQSLPDLHLLRNLVEPCTKASWNFCGTFCGTLLNLTRLCTEADLALHQSLPNLHRKLLRNAAEPDLALHQSLPGLLRNLLRNMTWLCTKASQTFTAIFSPEPYPEPY